jgi:hypothetical protein
MKDFFHFQEDCTAAEIATLLARFHSSPTAWFTPLRDEYVERNADLAPILRAAPQHSPCWHLPWSGVDTGKVVMGMGNVSDEIAGQVHQLQIDSGVWAKVMTCEAFYPASEAAKRLVVIHGDFKPDNVLRAADGKLIAIDYDLCQVGPAVHEFGYVRASEASAKKVLLVRPRERSEREDGSACSSARAKRARRRLCLLVQRRFCLLAQRRFCLLAQRRFCLLVRGPLPAPRFRPPPLTLPFLSLRRYMLMMWYGASKTTHAYRSLFVSTYLSASGCESGPEAVRDFMLDCEINTLVTFPGLLANIYDKEVPLLRGQPHPTAKATAGSADDSPTGLEIVDLLAAAVAQVRADAALVDCCVNDGLVPTLFAREGLGSPVLFGWLQTMQANNMLRLFGIAPAE